MPPESPLPGWSIGEVCTESTATRGLWPIEEGYRRRSATRGSTSPTRSPPPYHGRAGERRQLTELRAAHGVDLPEDLDQRRRVRAIAPVGDLHGDPHPLRLDRCADQRLRAFLDHDVAGDTHHLGVEPMSPTDQVGLGEHRGRRPAGRRGERSQALRSGQPCEQRRHRLQRHPVHRHPTPVDADHEVLEVGRPFHRRSRPGAAGGSTDADRSRRSSPLARTPAACRRACPSSCGTRGWGVAREPSRHGRAGSPLGSGAHRVRAMRVPARLGPHRGGRARRCARRTSPRPRDRAAPGRPSKPATPTPAAASCTSARTPGGRDRRPGRSAGRRHRRRRRARCGPIPPDRIEPRAPAARHPSRWSVDRTQTA